MGRVTKYKPANFKVPLNNFDDYNQLETSRVIHAKTQNSWPALEYLHLSCQLKKNSVESPPIICTAFISS